MISPRFRNYFKPSAKREIKECSCVPDSNEKCEECIRRRVVVWRWDTSSGQQNTIFQNNVKSVLFNPGFSVGTVCVRGSTVLQPDFHHYFEIELSTEVYGTDMMIGVGTESVDVQKYSHAFVSLLGLDNQSWGISYTGEIQHNGEKKKYTEQFGQYVIIGVHLDLWRGTLEFYKNRKPLGIAFYGLQNKTLYPMISSTSARSGMNLIFASSYPHSLELQSLLVLCKNMSFPRDHTSLDSLPIPPGIKVLIKNNYWWIINSTNSEELKSETVNKEKSSEDKKDNEKQKKKQKTNSSQSPSSSSTSADSQQPSTSASGVKTRSMAKNLSKPSTSKGHSASETKKGTTNTTSSSTSKEEKSPEKESSATASSSSTSTTTTTKGLKKTQRSDSGSDIEIKITRKRMCLRSDAKRDKSDKAKQ